MSDEVSDRAVHDRYCRNSWGQVDGFERKHIESQCLSRQVVPGGFMLRLLRDCTSQHNTTIPCDLGARCSCTRRLGLRQPFVDTSHPLQEFFLPRKYAIVIPTILVVILVTLVATFVGLTLMTAAAKRKHKVS